ncbi:four helix bundle protein [Nitratifractor sp.]|uniref:four helix bundle protein n=1 Tax=Nitratifractor sp. TaxID=2268144 RepID=UPI0025D6D9A4|nr:four helix bundle protein [Nitratifractor sp.]
MQTNIEELSYRFALRIVKLNEALQRHQHYVLSKQILRSGTAIGALAAEAQYAQSKPDFIHKLQIALKEANETRYWLRLLYDSNYVEEDVFYSLLSELESIIRILTRIINTSKKRLK